MEEDELIKKRFAEEVNQLKASRLAIAAKIGFSSQTFTNVTSGRNLPGALLLSRLSREYPTFDANYVLTGERKADESRILKKLREELDFKDSLLRITTMAAKGDMAGVGKAKGATYSPNRIVKKMTWTVPTVDQYTKRILRLGWVASGKGNYAIA